MAITNRTNTFHVRDIDAFVETLADEGFVVAEDNQTIADATIVRGENNALSLQARDGFWHDLDGLREIDEIIQEHIVPGSVAVRMTNDREAGHIAAVLITEDTITDFDFESELITAAAALAGGTFTNLD